jgi:hypothetical protein
MKTMKKMIYTALIAVVGLGFSTTGANAQQSDDDSIEVKATVLAPLDVTGNRLLQFGNLIPSIQKTIAATDEGAVTTLNQAGNDVTSSGKFTVTGAVGASVRISITTAEPQLGGDGATLPTIYTANWFLREGGERNQDDVSEATANPVTLGGTDIANFPVNGINVYLGGTVSPDAGQIVGSYSTNLTLTAIFN